MEDTKIVELYWSRDEAAIRQTDLKYGSMLHGIARSILHNCEDSEECVNDTYGKAWDTIPPETPGFLAAYLGRITRNISINRWHAGHAKKRCSGGADVMLSKLAECIPSAATVEQCIETKALSEVLNRWLYKLPQDDRVLFLQRYWFGSSLAALAEQRGTSPNRLAGRLYRLRQKLKGKLEEEEVSI